MNAENHVFVSRGIEAIVRYMPGRGWLADAYYDGEWGGVMLLDRASDLWSARQMAFKTLAGE